MANDAKRIQDLNTANTLSSTDRVVVLYNAATTTANVLTITVNNFIASVGASLTGPYTNDAAANAAGVVLKGLYYDATGAVRIRLA